MSIGKEEFRNFILFVNENKIELNQTTIDSLKKLIKIWNTSDDNTKLIYLENMREYEEITDYILSLKNKKLLNLWMSHVTILTKQKFNENDEDYDKKNLLLSFHSHDFLIKCNEYEDMSNDEKEMIKFYRKLKIIALMSGNKEYTNRTLIDKLFTNCNTTPYPHLSNEIEVRKSTIHGNGVFSKKTIKEGAIITFYPFDGYYDDNSKKYKTCNNWTMNDNYNFEEYLCVVNENLTIMGDSRKILNSSLLGHMFNDSIECCFKSLHENDIKNAMYDYYMKSSNNCKLKINEEYGIVYVLAIKDIEPNEELTFEYSPLYWFNKFVFNLTNGDLEKIEKYIEIFIDICNDKSMSQLIKMHL